MKRTKRVLVAIIAAVALIAAIFLAMQLKVPQKIAQLAGGTSGITVSLHKSSSAGSNPLAGNSVWSTANRVPVPMTPAQRFAKATNYKQLYDELSALPDETGEARYFMGRALVACNMFTGYRLEYHEKGIAPDQTTKLEAFREMSRLCDGFYGLKGPTARALWQEAAAKGYPGAVARTLDQLPKSEAETTAAQLVESGDAEALGGVLDFLQTRARFSTLELDGFRPPPQVTFEAWRLYVCSHGADCSPYLFQQCWSTNQCGAPTFASYLRDYQQQLYSPVVRLEAEIARAVQNHDWRSLGLVTSGTP